MTSRPLVPRFLLAGMLGLALASPALAAGDPNACDDPSEAPDVIVGDLHQVQRYGNVGGITAFAIGTTSCNVGTCWLNWITGSGANQHPTIGQNLFRLKAGRIEHVGQSWLKHGFYALSENTCSPDCIATDGEHLGVNCSDPYSSNLNGQQDRLGPKFEVNPLTGFHPHPVTNQSMVGDLIYKRLQVHDTDLDPAQNPGGEYFIEGQYVAQDDAAAGNNRNNVSHRPVIVEQRAMGGWRLVLAGETRRTEPGIMAWKNADPDVAIMPLDDPQGGRYWIAGKATDVGGGFWHYEYAIQNLTSDRAAGRFAVPLPDGTATASVGFHDVDYHSGEPFDGTDWSTNGGAGGVIDWSAPAHAVDPNANALRWGTLYNFRFDCDRPPATSLLTIGLFKPGVPGAGEPDTIVFPFLAPQACDGDGTCDPGESCFSCPGECSDDGPDVDGDGAGWCVDCAEGDASRWGVPSEVPMLLVSRGPLGEAVMTWGAPARAGSTPTRFEALRSPDPSDFVLSATCLRGADDTIEGLSDDGAAAAGPRLYYLVRGRSTCPVSEPGTTGGNSYGVERSAADCP
jgi:hypothetical protein